MREVNHPFASRIDSASAGGTMSPDRPRRPAIEYAAARNHASYSRRASTTWMRRSLRACVARSKIVAASPGGQSSSASRTIKTAPPGPERRAAKSTYRSSSFSLRNRSRLTRIGLGTCGITSGMAAAIRRIRIGMASTSPGPSTIVTIVDMVRGGSRTGRAGGELTAQDRGATGPSATTRRR